MAVFTVIGNPDATNPFLDNRGGSGDDTYTVGGAFTSGDPQFAVITDPTATIELVPGVEITSSEVQNDSLTLSFANGSQLTVLQTAQIADGANANAVPPLVDDELQSFNEYSTDELGVDPTTLADGESATGTGSVAGDDDGGGPGPGPGAEEFSIAADAPEQAEGTNGSTDFTFTVTRSGDTSGPNTVSFEVAGSGSDPANADDFAGAALPSGTVEFADGQSTATITVPVNADGQAEDDEQFQVELIDTTNGGTITTAVATATIQNDDGSLLELTTGQDTFTPTSGENQTSDGADNITGFTDPGGSTFQPNDVIDGGGGDDQLTLTLGTSTGGATDVTNVEEVFLTVNNSAGVSFNAQNFDAFNTFVSDASLGGLAINNVSVNQNSDGDPLEARLVNSSEDFTLDFLNTALDSNSANNVIDITLDNAREIDDNAPNLVIGSGGSNGFSVFNITSVGSDGINILDSLLENSSSQTLSEVNVVNGSSDLIIRETNAELTNFNSSASSFSGAVDVDLAQSGAGAVAVTVETGGADGQNDIVRLGTDFATTDDINLGGTADFDQFFFVGEFLGAPTLEGTERVINIINDANPPSSFELTNLFDGAANVSDFGEEDLSDDLDEIGEFIDGPLFTFEYEGSSGETEFAGQTLTDADGVFLEFASEVDVAFGAENSNGNGVQVDVDSASAGGLIFTGEGDKELFLDDSSEVGGVDGPSVIFDITANGGDVVISEDNDTFNNIINANEGIVIRGDAEVTLDEDLDDDPALDETFEAAIPLFADGVDIDEFNASQNSGGVILEGPVTENANEIALSGGSGDDQLFGNNNGGFDSGDEISGQEGEDSLIGDNGEVNVNGTPAAERLGIVSAAPGADQFTGGAGPDTFYFNFGGVLDSGVVNLERDLITDFDIEEDEIDLTAVGNALSGGFAGVDSDNDIDADPNSVELVRGDFDSSQPGLADFTLDETGDDILVNADINGDTIADFQIGLIGIGADINQIDGDNFEFGTANVDAINGLIIDGLGGDDTIIGGPGDDSLDGGDGNDDIDAFGGDDTIVGSAGNDEINGGFGEDTLDYTGLGEAVSLAQVGAIDKLASGGTDQLEGETGLLDPNPSIDVIIGDPAFGGPGDLDTVNEIDADNAPFGANFNIDLSANSLEIQNFAGGSTVEFEVQNFVNVIGTEADDTIAGDNQDNIIAGRNGTDELTGNEGDDDFQYVASAGDLADFGDEITDFDATGADQFRFDIGTAGDFFPAAGVNANDVLVLTDTANNATATTLNTGALTDNQLLNDGNGFASLAAFESEITQNTSVTSNETGVVFAVSTGFQALFAAVFQNDANSGLDDANDVVNAFTVATIANANLANGDDIFLA
ncbi:MAG: hypothetical protein GVY17_03315 [Cyanobacteria bacterium]|jgi:hypothetical protein|nr:hypothetical protein [Cyanobacteria bacterium GSL.Bin21]